MRRWLGRLALALLSLVLSAVGAELLLRAWLPPMPEWVMPGEALVDTSIFRVEILPIDQAPPDMETEIVGLVPGAVAQMNMLEYSTTVRVNQLGLRGPEVAPKAPNELRLLAIGDSFTLAIQHEESDTWPQRLGRALTERLDRPVTVLNGGVDDFGTARAVEVMRRVVPQADVDAVLLTFYTGNDLTDNCPNAVLARTLGVVKQDHPPPPPPPEEALETPWGRVLGRYSFIYTYLLARQASDKLAGDEGVTRVHREQLRVFDDPQKLSDYLGYTAQALRQYSQACARLRVDCYLAIAPPSYAIDTSRLASTWETYGLGEPPADIDTPSRAVASVVPREIPVIDLTEPLRDAGWRELYFIFDGHWNTRGTQVVTQALADFLEPRLRE